jgi:hypothetical protein
LGSLGKQALILDEMGYLPLDQVATSFLFQLVSKRYTKGCIKTPLKYFGYGLILPLEIIYLHQTMRLALGVSFCPSSMRLDSHNA